MAVNMNSLLYSNDENKRKAEQFLRERYGAATKEPTVNPSAFIPKKRKAEDVAVTGLNTIDSVLNQARIAETAKASAREASQAQNPLLNPVQTAKLSDFAKSKGIQQTVGVQKENPLDYARQQTLNSKTYKASILGMPLNNDQNQGILEEVKTENADPILYTAMQLGSGVASTPFSIQGGLSTMLSDAVTGGKTSNDFQKIAQYFEKNPERENIGLTKAESILSLGGINDLELANKIGVSPESLKRYRQSNVNDSVAQFIDNEVGATTPNWYKSSLGKAVYSIGAQVIPMMYTMGASSAVSGASSAGSDSFLGALMNGEKVSKALVNLVKPNATTILMGTSSASNKYSQLSKEYGSNPLNVVNAMATGYAEALTENLGGFTEAKSFAKMFSGESFKSNFLKYLMSMAEEGVEEVVNVPLEGITDKLTVETDKPWSGSGGVFDLENMIESGVQGALVSAIMGGSAFVSSTVNAVRQNRKVKAGVETLTGIAKTSLPGNMRPAPIDPQTATYEDFTKYASQVQDAIETFKDYVLSNSSNFTTGEYRTVSLPDGKKVLVDENNRYVSDADNASQSTSTGNNINAPANDAEAGRITLKEFTDNTNPVWNFVDYSDSKTKADITQKIAGKMIQAGNVVELTDSDLSKFDQYYPDLRGMKKQERTPILREKIKEVKNYLSSMLKEKFGGKTVEFTVNGNVLEAKLHDAGIREVLEKITKTKAAMIDKTGEIFSKAQYLYSTTDKAGNPDIYRWNYFYVPLKINEDTLGIRIAVRDVKKANESQIYNYGIKTEATLPEGPVSGQRPDFLSDGTSVASDNAALPNGLVDPNGSTLPNGHRTASTPIIPNFSQKSNAAENIVFPPYSDAMKRVVMPGITRSVKTGLSEERTVKQASSPRSEKSVTEKESHPVDDSLSFINPDVREVTTKLTETGRKVYQQLVSGQSTLERMSRIQKKMNHLKATSEELIQQYRNSGGTIDYIAEKGLVGRDGQKLGKSWKELIPQTKEGRQKLNQYMQNKHNIDRQAQGKPVLDKSAEASKAVVNSMNALDPAVSIQANEIYRFWDKFMNEWAVESGLLSKDQYSAMRKMYPNYIPTFRVNQQFNNASSAGYGSRISTSKIVKRAKGATSEIIPLEDAFMAQINKTVRAARKNEIIMDLVNFVREHPEAAAPYARLADPDSELAEAYKKGPDGFIEDVDYESVREIKKSKYQITGFENGKPVSLNVSKDVFDSVNDLFNRKVSAAEKIGKAITNPVKATTTGYNPFFAITNAVRDIQTGYVNTISDRKLFATYMADVFSAGREMVQNSADWELYQAMGGNRSGFYNNEKGFTRSALASRNKIQKGYDLVKKAASFFGERSEQLVRFTEFKNGLKKYGRTPDGIKKAMNAAADVTVNFARSGPTTKALDSWVMYLNAGVQGLDKMARQIKTSPVKTGRRAFELIGIPTIALWIINHLNPNYDDLDDRTKDNYFIIPNLFDLDENGNAQSFIKLPKSREYGAVMGAALERCLDFAFDGVPAEKAFKNLWETFATNLAPQNPFTDNIIGQFAVNLPNNKDFAGRDIVPARLQDLEPRYQYDYNTSEIAKRLGAAFNWSPKQVDYILNNNTGIIGDILLPMMSSGQPKNLQDLAGTVLSPLTRKFSADPLYQNGVVDQFYDDYDAAVRAAATSNFVNDTPAEAVTPAEKKVSFFAKISKQIAELRKEERKLLESAESESVRRPKIEDIRKQITDLARNAEERAQAFADEYAKTYVEETSHLSEKQQETARNGKQQGISNDTYLKFLEFVKSAESDKNSEGEAIPGSKKEKIVKYLNSQSLTADQKKFLLKSIGYKS